MSKYKIARELIDETDRRAEAAGLDRDDVLEALMTMCVQGMLERRGGDHVRDFLRYELDSVGTGDVMDIQRR